MLYDADGNTKLVNWETLILKNTLSGYYYSCC